MATAVESIPPLNKIPQGLDPITEDDIDSLALNKIFLDEKNNLKEVHR